MSSEQIYESEKGVRLFSGLDWRVAPDGNLNKGIRSLAKDREAKYFVTLAAREPEEIARGDKRIEVIRNSVGYFVPSLDVEKPPRKSHSLAAAFALMTRNDPASMLVLTRPDGGYAMVVVVNGVPVFDKDERETKKALSLASNYLGEVQDMVVYADDVIQFPQSVLAEGLHDALVDACGKQSEIRQVPLDLLKYGSITLAIAGLLGGWHFYKQHELEKERQALIKAQQERDPTRRYLEALSVQKRDVKALKREDILAAYATIRSLPLMVGGWSVKEIGCKTGAGCVVRLTRVIGTADTLKDSTGGILKFIPPNGVNLGVTDMTWDTEFGKQPLPDGLTNMQDFMQGRGASILQTWATAKIAPAITAATIWPSVGGVPKDFKHDAVIHRGRISVGAVPLAQFEELITSAPENVVWTDFQITLGDAYSENPLRSAMAKVNGSYFVRPAAFTAVPAGKAASGAASGAAPAPGLSASAVGIGLPTPADAASRARTATSKASQPENLVDGFTSTPG